MLSLIIPIYNEKELVRKNIPKIEKYLKGIKYEILLCDNGSDNWLKYETKHTRYLRIEEKGLGLGIKLGLKHAKYDNIMFYAIDLPFGLKIIKDSLKYMKDYDVVIGSKAHPQSINNHTLKRKLFSKAFNTMINISFHLKIKDTQGSLMFKKKVKKYKKIDAKDAFFQTQILIQSKKHGDRIVEIPVEYKSQRKGSKIKPVRYSIHMLKNILKEKIR